jgi:DNA-binding transcriptional MerR regulator
MKTGKVAKLFGIDNNTVVDWTNRFSEFFTLEALGETHSQREYQPEDLIIINTVRAARKDNTSWEQIRADLEIGERETALPPEIMTMQGDSALVLYTQLRTAQLELRNAQEEIERLRSALAEKDSLMRDALREKDAVLIEKDRILLERERSLGRLEGLAELYERMWKEEREKGEDK